MGWLKMPFHWPENSPECSPCLDIGGLIPNCRHIRAAYIYDNSAHIFLVLQNFTAMFSIHASQWANLPLSELRSLRREIPANFLK